MTCLSSGQIQAVADGEGSQADQAHAASCAVCRRAVAGRRDQVTAMRAALGEGVMPHGMARRVEASLADGPPSGATRLRSAERTAWIPAAWGTAGLVGATLAAVFVVAPLMKPDQGAVSASEVLARSATRLAEPVTGGVEMLEYELTLDGVPKEMMVDHASGTYLVRQAIDHTVPGRFRFASYAPGGAPISSIAQDPVQGRRTVMFNLEGQGYRFDVSLPAAAGLSLPEMERLHMEASIAMMQASGHQMLEVVDTPAGRQYRIEVPRVTTPVVSPVWDLTEARVLINASDYRVSEFAVSGTFLKQRYSIAYRLVSRAIVATPPLDTFDVPAQPGEIVLSGEGSALPAHDIMVIALRELAKVKQSRE
ncbi:MAG TPA: hypothetical protein VNJ03_01285 [Vicinamibacterales bacterium]|nr:hypothetical protein [Vicinamibacterales bacterium]